MKSRSINPLINSFFTLGISCIALVNQANSAEFFDDKVHAKLMFMQGFQAIEANSGAFAISNADMAPGFQRLRFNIELAVKIHDYVTAYADLG